MKPITVRGHNTDCTKPAGYVGDCGTLPVRREVEGVGPTAKLLYISNWQPSPEELALLVQGGVVELCCVAFQQPVALSVVRRHVEAADDSAPGV